jgi:hypothetical protein
MVSKPTVYVNCDSCGKTEQRPAFDLRWLQNQLVYEGWKLEGGLSLKTICPQCICDGANDDSSN